MLLDNEEKRLKERKEEINKALKCFCHNTDLSANRRRIISSYFQLNEESEKKLISSLTEMLEKITKRLCDLEDIRSSIQESYVKNSDSEPDKEIQFETDIKIIDTFILKEI